MMSSSYKAFLYGCLTLRSSSRDFLFLWVYLPVRFFPSLFTKIPTMGVWSWWIYNTFHFCRQIFYEAHYANRGGLNNLLNFLTNLCNLEHLAFFPFIANFFVQFDICPNLFNRRWQYLYSLTNLFQCIHNLQ